MVPFYETIVTLNEKRGKEEIEIDFARERRVFRPESNGTMDRVTIPN